ncbi:hypothetical protein J5X92_04300 [Alteromonas sp. K632G]|jgi:hypothetical protein|uniref:hypothetical protein n=1 Tax=Alteromonas sp. K632G TaxID=2820757 RepID=UPI000C10D162|nr:hypothetical protein [Alteromonas sp. K632G]MBB66179.1 hypothetical protein [Rickettsiales bacterium]MBO7921437.1 hypothetical protein [Alteromonas sp. K632G]PHS55290.1 MAG: hypothetical protein COB03_09955 [Alteromonas sp.]|tara:strand:- start:2136 stop:3020 length:885 start_codon:yes stop_codon:yes gene_type:complete
MSIKTVITHQYHLPMSIEEMVALSDGRCAALSWRKDAGYQFILLQDGSVDTLPFVIPYELGVLSCAALFITKTGFGCVFHDSVVIYTFTDKEFKTYPFSTPLPLDAAKHSTAPVKAYMDELTGTIHVILEDYFYKRRGRFISTISLNNNIAYYSPLYTFPFNTAWYYECADICFNEGPLVHIINCPFMWRKIEPCPSNSAHLMKLNDDGNFQVTPTIHGRGSFSSDKQYLMVKSIFSPYSIHFYTLDGAKAYVLNLTPKRVLGNIDKKWLENVDKFNDTLWLAHDHDVTQVRLL